MERNLFNNLIENYTSLTADEAKELIRLAQDFPYCQSIHNLAARAAQDNNLNSKMKLLNVSAMYSCDRSALKSTMTTPVKARVRYESSSADKAPAVVLSTITTVSELDNEKLRQQILADIDSMHESKRIYEEVIAKMENDKPTPLTHSSKKSTTTSNFESIKENPEGLIEEIKSSKKKIKPEAAKQIEQIEIIDKFIKTQPTITRPKATEAISQTDDLSDSSETFGENIISETLVEILLKQGKREKAIEILKKLIWKYPQKKAYFASQIEDLRK